MSHVQYDRLATRMRRLGHSAWCAICILCGAAATCSLALVAKAVYVELL